jgi:hypothetical protein
MLMPTTNPPAKQAQGSRASGWLSTIRARLYLAFGFAAALTIIGASIAFYEFTIIGSTTNEIVSRSLPATAGIASPRGTGKQSSILGPAPDDRRNRQGSARRSWPTSTSKKKISRMASAS